MFSCEFWQISKYTFSIEHLVTTASVVKSSSTFCYSNVVQTEAATRSILYERVFLEISQNSQENTCARASFLIKLQALGNFIKRETLALVFSCEFGGISKNIFFTEHLLATASLQIDLFIRYIGSII